jgi:hypothetical protein
MKRAQLTKLLVVLALLVQPTWAGPPYVTDDPEPTEFRQFEIYLFAAGSDALDGSEAAAGIDFNYGAVPDLQLTAVFPVARENPAGTSSVTGLGNIELAAKYRFLHQEQVGWDIAVFPRYILPSASSQVGDQHSSIVLPVWVQRDWDPWSTFGGGGCVIQHGGEVRSFCFAGWAVTHAFSGLELGLELVHRTAEAEGGSSSSTAMGAGLSYDISEHYHLLASVGPTLRNAAETTRYSWYASLLFTF